MNQRQIDLLSDMLKGWPAADILSTMRYILTDCQRFPTPYDWNRLRPPPPQESSVPSQESIADTTQRLADTAPTSWARFVMAETTKGLRAHDMPAAYDRIITEGERRKIDPTEIAAFRQAKVKTLEVRAGRIRAEREAKEAEVNRKRATRAAVDRARNAK